MWEVASMKRSEVVLVAILIVILAVAGSLYYGWNAKLIGSQSKGAVNVLYAGSLLDTMEGGIAPSFAAMGYDYKGEGHGSVQNANFLIDGQRFPDVFISAGVPPIQMLENNDPPLAKWYVVFASDSIVIAYSNKSRFVGLLNEASQGTIPWYGVLAAPQIRFLRTDPEQDPKGYYMVMVAKLAELYYGNSSISSLILRGDRNPSQIRPEEVLTTLLESAECDAIPLYRHEAVERGLLFITLPPEINLGDPSHANYYKQANYTLQTNKIVYGQPIVFTVTIPTTAKNSDGAIAFVKFLLSDTGQQTLRKHGFSQVPYEAGGDLSAIPPAIEAIVNSQS
jgi:molybdate/tungstate transport system substrate-binding protein